MHNKISHQKKLMWQTIFRFRKTKTKINMKEKRQTQHEEDKLIKKQTTKDEKKKNW